MILMAAGRRPPARRLGVEDQARLRDAPERPRCAVRRDERRGTATRGGAGDAFVAREGDHRAGRGVRRAGPQYHHPAGARGDDEIGEHGVGAAIAEQHQRSHLLVAQGAHRCVGMRRIERLTEHRRSRTRAADPIGHRIGVGGGEHAPVPASASPRRDLEQLTEIGRRGDYRPLGPKATAATAPGMPDRAHRQWPDRRRR